jgi:hypothetical protein
MTGATRIVTPYDIPANFSIDKNQVDGREGSVLRGYTEDRPNVLIVDEAAPLSS